MKPVLRAALVLAAFGISMWSPHALPACAAMDFNGDCKSDLLWRNSATGENYIFLMNGRAVGAQGPLLSFAGSGWQVRGVADFNGDGKADILWRNSATGENQMYLMDGLTMASRGLVDFVAGAAWQVVGAADFNGDGKADILWRNSVTGENYLYLMNGRTIVLRASINVVPLAWRVAGIGDFNGDGRADVLWRNGATGENYLYFMNGPSIAAEGPVNHVADAQWQVRGIGDFNGDRKADILWRNGATGENYLYLMNGRSIAWQGPINTVADPAWQVIGVGDFSGDGKADIAWRNSTTGENYMYLMNGKTIVAEGPVEKVADPNWMARTTTTIADATGPDQVAPSLPASLTAAAVSSSRIDLSWGAARDNIGVTEYRVYRDGHLAGSVAGTAYSSTGLSAATTYSYAIAAHDAAGNASGQSGTVSATTAAAPAPTPAPPPAPTPVTPVPTTTSTSTSPTPVASATLPPPPPPPSAPPPAPPSVQPLWTAGMESGSLVEFEGENNSGAADSIAVLAASEGIPARSGSWVMKQSVLGSSGGTRMYRYSTLNSIYRSGNPIYYSFWAYFPQATRHSGFFNLLQVQSINPSGVSDPVWMLAYHPSNFSLRLEWWSLLQMAGPHAGESGGKVYDWPVSIPVGQWVFIQFMIVPREDYTGAIKVWLNEQVIFDVPNVRTKYPESLVPAGTQSFFISKNAYGTGLTPTPNHHYVDDVAISLEPLPYVPFAP